MTRVKVLTTLGALGLIATVLFAVAIFFSSVESRYECSGTFSKKEATSKDVIFIKINRYRWWVKLWSPSDGALWVEIPGRGFDYYSSLTTVGDQLQISRTDEELKGLWGYYSSLSNTLVLETFGGMFTGQCSKLKT
ncbi:hypothetical protein [Hylemonella gracilis]|uniref:hypothetical protein n=1 Tax=Hylemonella gracilis TaxID=80880 RepID=UPI0012DE3979|nr:hypothetical protein [Hylemonella gracilis]